MNRLFTQAAAALSALALIFSLAACDSQVTDEDPFVSEDVQPSASAGVVIHADNRFTVRYNSNYSLNPITGTNPDNVAIVPLIYEGLFVPDENWQPQPVLCQSYETSDGLTYTFFLKPDISMHDGSTLTAQDVRYSLSCAMEEGRFSGRLHNIESVAAVDELTVEITLKTASYKLPVFWTSPSSRQTPLTTTIRRARARITLRTRTRPC